MHTFARNCQNDSRKRGSKWKLRVKSTCDLTHSNIFCKMTMRTKCREPVRLDVSRGVFMREKQWWTQIASNCNASGSKPIKTHQNLTSEPFAITKSCVFHVLRHGGCNFDRTPWDFVWIVFPWLRRYVQSLRTSKTDKNWLLGDQTCPKKRSQKLTSTSSGTRPTP
jgi:hypothetical protein